MIYLFTFAFVKGRDISLSPAYEIQERLQPSLRLRLCRASVVRPYKTFLRLPEV